MSKYELAKKLAKEVGLGRPSTEFSKKDTNKILREAFLEEIGIDTFDQYSYEQHKHSIFRVITEVIEPIINDRLVETMGRFADVRNTAWGEKYDFRIDNPDLYEVAVVATGDGDLRRQRLENGKLEMTMSNYGVTIYDEFYRFLAGLSDWDKAIDKVARSFEQQIAVNAMKAIYDSYNSIDTEFKFTGSYDEDELLKVLAMVEAANGNAVIVGTKQALSKIKPEYIGGAGKDGYQALGYVGVFNGYETVELTQSLKAGTNEFNLSPTDLLILPSSSDKIVKIVHEGQALIRDKQNDADFTIEHRFIKRVGVGVAIANRYGIVRFT